MDFDEAARVASQIVNTLKKFAHAQEVIEAAMNAAASLSVLSPKVDAMKAELARLTGEKETLSGELTAAKVAHADDLLAAENKWREEFGAEKAEAQTELNALTETIKAAMAQHKKVMVTRKATLATLDAQAQAAEERLRQAQADLSALKNKL